MSLPLKNENHQQPDLFLVDRFLKTRTPASFEPLAQANIDRIRRIIFRIVLSNEDAEDLTQETFIRAYEKLDDFKGKAKFSTWLCQIGVNLAISHVRQKERRRMKLLSNPIEEPSFQSPHQRKESKDELRRIHQAISQLPEKLRAVVVLSIIEEVPAEEIARILKCPRATVYWRLHHAKKILAKRLEVSK